MVVAQLSELFGSKTKAREMLLLLADVKPVVRQAFYRHEIIFQGFLQHHGLSMVVSPYTVQPSEKEYANRSKLAKDGMHFVYISKNESLCYQAALAEAKGDHKMLGKLLGYPSCCIDFFVKAFPWNYNPQLQSHHWQLNLSKRAQDCVLLSHFPCKDCSRSVELADRYFVVLKELDCGDADNLSRTLSS